MHASPELRNKMHAITSHGINPRQESSFNTKICLTLGLTTIRIRSECNEYPLVYKRTTFQDDAEILLCRYMY